MGHDLWGLNIFGNVHKLCYASFYGFSGLVGSSSYLSRISCNLKSLICYI